MFFFSSLSLLTRFAPSIAAAQVVLGSFFWNGLYFLDRVLRSYERHEVSDKRCFFSISSFFFSFPLSAPHMRASFPSHPILQVLAEMKNKDKQKKTK